MKKLAILSAIALSGLIYNTADAQIRINFGLHIRPIYARYQAPVVVEQPVYQEPVQAYDDSNDDDYYYLPDVDAYYDVNAGCYYYNDGNDWISAAYLPGAYRNYDWRSARRFEVREHRPFARADFYRSRFNGRQVAEFRNYHRDNNGYNRGNDNRFDNRGWGYNRPERNRDNDNHYGNRGQGGYNQPSYPDHNQNNGNHNQGGYNQPSYPDHNQNNGNHNQGGYGQPGQNNGGHDGQGHSAQPSQNNGGNRGRGGDEHFAQNMGIAHRMARY